MLETWFKDGIGGKYTFPKGEVVYQTPVKGTIVIEPVYVTGVPFESGARYYLEVDGKLQETFMNPFNGYFYRQDGK